MKKTILFIISVFFSLHGISQQIEGSWHGLLKVQGMELHLVFNISQDEDGLKATMDSPDQGAHGIAVDATAFKDGILTMAIPMAAINYTGTLSGDTITGTFAQAGMEIPLNLTREVPEKTAVVRPQEPQKPYPYQAEEVFFKNPEADITLAGTLTLPREQGTFPAVVMITGSGPQNRDEEILGHKPFLVIADHLTRHGIAVLRFDDRGVAQSEGDFSSATSYDFATDVEAAVAYLLARDEIDPAKIGLIGHSEGGIIAPIVAGRNTEKVNFIVLLAGTGIRGDKLLLEQQLLIGKAMGMGEEEMNKNQLINRQIFELVLKNEEKETLESNIRALMQEALADTDEQMLGGMPIEQFIDQQTSLVTSPWMSTFLRLDPAVYLEKVRCPVLAVNGSNDLQVPPSNLQAIETSLHRGGNTKVTLKEFPGLNHLFQECDTGSPTNYAAIEQTFAPEVLEKLSSWINAVTTR